MKHKQYNILLAGGGSGGPVSPLLAVAKELSTIHPHLSLSFLLVGTSKGPERQMAESAGIAFTSVPVAKLRRYYSIKNLLLPFELIIALLRSFYIVLTFRPSLVFGAGSFVQVPLMFMARVFGAKVVIHQQDVVVSLSNFLCSFIAKKITVSFKETEKDFPDSVFLSGLKQKSKTVFTGNPSNLPEHLPKRSDALEKFGLASNLPVVLVFGGGTGAVGLNKLLVAALPEITKFAQVVHALGKGKGGKNKSFENPNYHPFEFISDMPHAYAAADVVVCRAGLSTITELSKYGKISIIIPMPDSHQEANGELLSLKKAAMVLAQSDITPEMLTTLIRKLGFAGSIQKTLALNMQNLFPNNATAKVTTIVSEVLLEQDI